MLSSIELAISGPHDVCRNGLKRTRLLSSQAPSAVRRRGRFGSNRRPCPPVPCAPAPASDCRPARRAVRRRRARQAAAGSPVLVRTREAGRLPSAIPWGPCPRRGARGAAQRRGAPRPTPGRLPVRDERCGTREAVELRAVCWVSNGSIRQLS